MEKNTIATVGMWFSIIGLILLITILFSQFWLILLFIWLILWIIGLFRKPRWKARIAVCIPLIVFISLISLACYVWNSIKTPINEFKDWAEPQLKQLESEDFDEDRFSKLLSSELNNIGDNKSEEDWKDLFESSTGSNLLEKGAYLLTSLLRQSMETALEKYNDGELPEIDDEEDNDLIDVDIEVNDDENDEEALDEEKDEDEVEDEEDIENNRDEEKAKNETVEVFNNWERNDIEEIIDILE